MVFDTEPTYDMARQSPALDQKTIDSLANEVGADVLASLLCELENEIHERTARLTPDTLGADRRAVEVDAHALKSVARSFGLRRLGEWAFCLEYAAAENSDMLEAATLLAAELPKSLSIIEGLKQKFGT